MTEQIPGQPSVSAAAQPLPVVPLVQPIRSVCVYCGSSSRVEERFKHHAAQFGQMLAERGITLVYGGGRVGLMGIIADAALQAGGTVVGIIPEHIKAKEIEHRGLTELHVVDSMHTRKRMMAERSDAYVVLPGGLGTLDETFEIITWKQLQLHTKPIVIFDDGGFWQPLLALLETLITSGFAPAHARSLYHFTASLEGIFTALAMPSEKVVPVETKWM